MNISTLRRLPLYLFLLAFLVRVGFVLTLEDRLYWPDERDFVNIALGLVQGEGYQSAAYRANPILPFFLASIYQLVGYGHLVPRLLQSLVGALAVPIIFAITRRLFGRRVAFLAGIAAALYPPLIYISGVFYVECLFTTLLALSVYLLYLSSQYRSVHFSTLLIFSGVVIGITILCRPIFLAFLPFAVFFAITSYAASTARKLVYAFALVMVALFTILPWTLRNYSQYNRVLLVAAGSGEYLWKGNNELSTGDTYDRVLHPGIGDVWSNRLQQTDPTRRGELSQKYSHVQHDLEALDEIDQDRYLQRLALKFVREHPTQSLVLFGRKVRTLYTAFTEVQPEHRKIFGGIQRLTLSLVFYPMLILGIVGIVLGLRHWRKYLILYLPVISLTCAYGVLTSASRHRIPLEPYMLIFASYGALYILDSFRMCKILAHYDMADSNSFPVTK